MIDQQWVIIREWASRIRALSESSDHLKIVGVQSERKQNKNKNKV